MKFVSTRHKKTLAIIGHEVDYAPPPKYRHNSRVLERQVALLTHLVQTRPWGEVPHVCLAVAGMYGLNHLVEKGLLSWDPWANDGKGYYKITERGRKFLEGEPTKCPSKSMGSRATLG